MKVCLGKMKVTARVRQESIETTDVLSSVDQRTEAPCKELKMKIEETEPWLQLPLDTWTLSLSKETADTKEDLHKELDLWIQGTQVQIDTTRTLVETT
jgi:predicted RNA methylase